MYLLPGLVIAALVMITAAAVTLRRWARARLQAAQWRLARETWQEMAASPAAGAPDWPDSLTGCMHFFGTNYVAYDPAADAAVYCEAMTADVQAWITGLHQAA